MAEYFPLIEYLESGGKFEPVEIEKSPVINQMLEEMQKRWPGIRVNVFGATKLWVSEVPEQNAVIIEEDDDDGEKISVCYKVCL